MKVMKINPESPLFGKIRKGYELISINGESVRDNLDFMYKSSEDRLSLIFVNKDGKQCHFEVNNEQFSDIGLDFETDKIYRCKNKCIFCFIHQQPKGLRRSLYVRDDDYRFSFTHGNFISLSNLTKDDIERIIEQRLSPLYISVHATDDKLRRCIFKNEKLPAILPLLKRLIEGRIMFHTQVVVCPGVNDGEELNHTIHDLHALYPAVQTLGIVPVGLTKYRDKLPTLDRYDRAGSEMMINFIHKLQKEFLKKSGTRFVFAADEFYIMARRDFPNLSEYEEMAQFENGIGMMRQFLTDFNRRKRYIRPIDKSKRIAMLTGESAYESLSNEVVGWMKAQGIGIDLVPVKNMFWGDTVTVSGLLTGRDMSDKLNGLKRRYNTVILPPNCLNNDNLFLDDMSLDEFRSGMSAEVVVGCYNFTDTIREVLQ